MAAVREAARRLRAGHVLLLFPDGIISPDPETVPGAFAHLDHWSSSVEILLRRAPQAHLIVCIISGVLARRWWQHPFARLWRDRMKRQRIAEFMQIIVHMGLGKSPSLRPHLTASSPLSVEQLRAESDSPRKLLPSIKQHAKETYWRHIGWLTAKGCPIADPEDVSRVVGCEARGTQKQERINR
jgi:hypothetical protein